MGVEADGRPSVLVVGGGAAGLAAARDLAARGARVTLLEAHEHLGGCVATRRVGGLTLDVGAEAFATRTPTITDLIGELGLADEVVTPAASGAWVRLPGRTIPLPATGVLGIPAQPWAKDVRRALGIVGSARASLDRWLPTRVGLPPGDTSVADLVRWRMGRRVLDRLVGPVVGGVYSTAAELSDLDTVLPGVRELVRRRGSLAAAVAGLRTSMPAGSNVASLVGGMSRLLAALEVDAVARGVTIRRGSPVRAVQELAGEGGERGGWRVTLGGSATAGEALTADHLLLAVPGPVAVHLLTELVPEADELAGPTSDVALVTLVVDAPALDAAPRGTGVLVAPEVTRVRAKALTHATAKWEWLARAAGPGRHVLRLSYGRAGPGLDQAVSAPARREHSDLAIRADDRELKEAALHDAAILLGVTLGHAQVVDAAVTRWTGTLPFARPGHRARVQEVRAALAARPGLYACGSWVAGTGLAAVVADARATAAQVRLES